MGPLFNCLLFLFLQSFFSALSSNSFNQRGPSPDSICENVPDPNNWTFIFNECQTSTHFGSSKVWDLSSVPSSFDLTRFLSNKVIIAASIRMVDTSLESLVFGVQLERLGNRNGSIIISGNKRLMNLRTPMRIVALGTTIINNNRKISELQYNLYLYPFEDRFENSFFGECIFKTVSNLTDITFKDCVTAAIEGDLVIKGKRNFFGTDTIITRIDGCLIVRDTQLTLLDFVQLDNDRAGRTDCIDSGRTSEIVNNHYLCLSRTDKKNLNKWFPGIKISNNENCSHICSSEEVVRDKTTGCKVLFGDLHLPNDTTRYIESLENVEELNGRLIITGTQYESIQFLKKLKAIYTDSTEPTVLIKGNPQLHSINLKSMTTIGSSADLLFSAYENQRLILSREEYEQWLKLARGRMLRIRVKKEQTSDDDAWRILGICLICLFVVLYLVTSVLSFFTIRPDRRKKKKD